MNMGSKEKNDPNNFSQKNQGTIKQAPGFLKAKFNEIKGRLKYDKSGPYYFARTIGLASAAILGPRKILGIGKATKIGHRVISGKRVHPATQIPQAAAVARQLRNNPKLKSIMENTVYKKGATFKGTSTKDMIQSNIDKRIQKLTSNVPKVKGGYVPKGYKSYPGSITTEYRVGGKLYGHYTKEGKLTNKFIKKGK